MPDVAPTQRLHHARQAVDALRRHQKMHVIGHQHIGVNGATMLGGDRDEPVAIADVVLLAIEDRFAVVAPLDDVQGLIGKKIAAESGHGRAPPAGIDRTLPLCLEKIHSDPIFYAGRLFLLRASRQDRVLGAPKKAAALSGSRQGFSHVTRKGPATLGRR